MLYQDTPWNEGAYDCAMRQYAGSNGRVYGYDGGVDLDKFYGDAEAWMKYANPGGEYIAPAPAAAPVPVASAAPTASSTTYIVQKGDTLSAIAARYGTTYQSLAAINNIPDANKIYPGQEIIVNGTQEAAPAASAAYYTIKPGDTLSGIAERYGTTCQWLAQINGINDPDLIYPGNSIRVS